MHWVSRMEFRIQWPRPNWSSIKANSRTSTTENCLGGLSVKWRGYRKNSAKRRVMLPGKRPGPIFSERVISPPAPPEITSAADALAVVLNECGRVDIEHIAELLHKPAEAVVDELGDAIFRDPADGSWQTSDAYLAGPVRTKLAVAEAAVGLDPAYECNVRALQAVQPADLRPSDITARLGAPWIPASDVVAFVKEMMGDPRHAPKMSDIGVYRVEPVRAGFTDNSSGFLGRETLELVRE